MQFLKIRSKSNILNNFYLLTFITNKNDKKKKAKKNTRKNKRKQNKKNNK